MNKFIKKLETDDYKIGSFDVFIQDTKKLIKEKYNMTDEEVEDYLKQMPTTYRASIVDNAGNYVGFIGIKNVDFTNEMADILFEVNDGVEDYKKQEILKTYKRYLYDYINIKKYNEKVKKGKSKIVRSKYIIPGIDDKVLDTYKEMYPDMPKLVLPATLSMNGITFGVVGLSNVIRPNMRADLRIYLSKNLGSFDSLFIAELIDNYIEYVHKNNIWNVSLEVGANKHDLVEAINESNMSYYGTIPFADVDGNTIGNLLLFQHTPHMLNDYEAIKSEIYVSKSIFDTSKDEMSDIILLDDQYKMVRPRIISDTEGVSPLKTTFENVLEDFSKAMSNRVNFTVPLGDDKYFPQVGNQNYGLYKAMKNYSYIILDKDDKFIGFINILRQDREKKHCEIEAGIIPSKQNQGIGRLVTNRFYDELFSLGYASVTTKVFDFNKKSKHLSDEISEYNGRRIQSYYVNGKLWDMDIYTKLNPLVEKVKIR